MRVPRQASSPNLNQDPLSLRETIGPPEPMARPLVLNECLGVGVLRPHVGLMGVGAYLDDLSPDRFHGPSKVVDVQPDRPAEDCK